jgi:hypothetical protein
MKKSIEQLENEELSAVSFVRDYVELHFDGPIIRALVDPILMMNTQRITAQDKGWRDALCGLIGHTLARVILKEGVSCRLEFGIRGTVEVDFATAAPESLHFVPGPNQPIQVW